MVLFFVQVIVIFLSILSAIAIYLVFVRPSFFKKIKPKYVETVSHLYQKPTKTRVLVMTVILLFLSNIFMAAAWYAHLKFDALAVTAAILMSWFIAIPEYILHVPANKFAHDFLSTAQLKTLQSIFTIVGFCIFSFFYFDMALSWNHIVAFILLVAGSALVFKDEKK